MALNPLETGPWAKSDMNIKAMKWCTAVGSVLCLWLALQLHASEVLRVGAKAPLIEAKNQDGKVWSLAKALKSHAVLLYFYPKDETPGCTKQACGLRDRIGDLKTQGVEVVGISRDSADSHKAFIAKHSLNFPLLPDVDGKITAAFGAQMEGREMSRRISFLIRKDGTIAHITDTMKADTHLEEMQDAAGKLKVR